MNPHFHGNQFVPANNELPLAPAVSGDVETQHLLVALILNHHTRLINQRLQMCRGIKFRFDRLLTWCGEPVFNGNSRQL